eukprot:10085107-Alexandrium_andersonii.AAC.1
MPGVLRVGLCGFELAPASHLGATFMVDRFCEHALGIPLILAGCVQLAVEVPNEANIGYQS